MTKESGRSLLACHKKTKVGLLTVFLFLSISYVLCTSAEAALCYVKYDAAGANNGASWTNAYTDLQSALADISCTEVWVAAGTYNPGALRSSTFQLKNGVSLYGGFIGTETSLGQRDPATNVTILSGDIGTVGDITDNCRHVVNGSGTNSTAILDGFTITLGNADGLFGLDGVGGGMLNNGGSPTLANLIFSNNSARNYGGGMENLNSSNPTLTNVTFSLNTAGNGGGGMDNDTSNPTLTSVTFSGNTATNGGGGMNNNGSSPPLTNVTFSGNTTGGSGGGIFNGSSSTPMLSYVTFSGNIAALGGGIYNFISGTICNSCILWNDTGGEISGPAVATVTYSTVQGGYAGTGNSGLDPLLGTLGNYGGYTQTIPLLSGSPARNTIPIGTNGCGTTITTDQRGVIRPQGSGCDMGAYEFFPRAAVPTMNEWGMIIFTILAGIGAVRYLSRRRRA